MKKHEVNLEMKIAIEFDDQEAVHAYFLDSDWKDTFYSYTDFNDFIEGFVYSFEAHDCYFNKAQLTIEKDVEGFGIYIKDTATGTYFSSPETIKIIGSKITVKIVEELSVQSVTAIGVPSHE